MQTGLLEEVRVDAFVALTMHLQLTASITSSGARFFPMPDYSRALKHLYSKYMYNGVQYI